MTVLLLGMAIGLVLGLTGAGGSVLAVPLLMMLLKLPMATASGLSLAAVSLAAGLGVVLRWRSGYIQWWLVGVLALTGSLLTPVGQALGRMLPETGVLVAFVGLSVAIGLRMWQQATQQPEATRVLRAGTSALATEAAPVCRLSGEPLYRQSPCLVRLLLAGAATGLLSGLFGVGGGFVIVPLLVLFTGIGMLSAVATSLGVISLVSATGFVSFLLTGTHDWPQLLWLLIGASAGMALGSVLAPRVAGPGLQQGFAVLVWLTALLTLGQMLR